MRGLSFLKDLIGDNIKKTIPYIAIIILSIFIGRFSFVSKPEIIYQNKFNDRIINYNSITDSITKSISNIYTDTSYTIIDSVIINYKDSLIIRDSISAIPYSVVPFNYSDSLLFASANTYYNNKQSKYDFKYTIKPTKYSLTADYNTPDTLKINFRHKHFFNKDTIIILNNINQYLSYEINKIKRPWYDSYWVGALSTVILVSTTFYLIK